MKGVALPGPPSLLCVGPDGSARQVAPRALLPPSSLSNTCRVVAERKAVSSHVRYPAPFSQGQEHIQSPGARSLSGSAAVIDGMFLLMNGDPSPTQQHTQGSHSF